MPQLRKVVFLVFAAIYVVIAPVTVLYALGYIFNPAQQTLLQTGLVSLATEPSQAKVWVNGSLVKDRTPVVLHNLKPGTYDIRIDLPGHQSWQRHVQVKPDRALRFENILLFPDRFEPESLSRFPVTQITHAPGAKHLIVLHGDTASGLLLFDLEGKQSQPLLPQTRYEDAKVESISFHPWGNRALVILQKDRNLIPLFVRFENLLQSSIQAEELTPLFPEPLTYPRWSSTLKDSLFYLKGNTLRRVDLDSGTTFPALVRSVHGYALYARRLFVLDEKNRFLELTEKGKVRNVLLDDPVKSQLIFGKGTEGLYSIFFLPRESLFFLPHYTLAFFLSDKGRLVCNKLPYFLDEDVSEVALAISKPRIAYRKGKELWVVDFEREREKGFFENGPTPRRIYHGKEELSRLFWFYDDQYLLFLEGNQLWVQNFEGEENPVELFDISKRVHDVFVDEKSGFVYFAEAESDRLARVKLFR